MFTRTRRHGVIQAGRLDDLRSRPDADRIAYTVSRHMLHDYPWKVYASRAALLAFAKPDSAHHALIKDVVEPNMLTNRNTQRPAR